MSLKKIVTTFFVSILTLLLPVASAFADSAGWQLVENDITHWNSTLNAWITDLDDAHVSGNVRICNEDHGGRLFTIKEYDPDSADEVVASNRYLEAKACLSYDIRPWVDGNNKQAEIYVQTQNSYSQWTIWD